jgi:hypothetical protein
MFSVGNYDIKLFIKNNYFIYNFISIFNSMSEIKIIK